MGWWFMNPTKNTILLCIDNLQWFKWFVFQYFDLWLSIFICISISFSVNDYLNSFEQKVNGLTNIKLILEKDEAIKMGLKDADAYPFKSVERHFMNATVGRFWGLLGLPKKDIVVVYNQIKYCQALWHSIIVCGLKEISKLHRVLPRS